MCQRGEIAPACPHTPADGGPAVAAETSSSLAASLLSLIVIFLCHSVSSFLPPALLFLFVSWLTGVSELSAVWRRL